MVGSVFMADPGIVYGLLKVLAGRESNTKCRRKLHQAVRRAKHISVFSPTDCRCTLLVI